MAAVKYEEVYLRAHDSMAEARGSIGGYLAFYNRKRPHSSLNGRSPDQSISVAGAGGGRMMFAAVEIVRRETVNRNRNAVQTNPVTPGGT
jgi:hypothetical protein